MHTETVKQELLLKNTVWVAKAASCCSCFSHSSMYSFMACVAGECKADKWIFRKKGEFCSVDVDRAFLAFGQEEVSREIKGQRVINCSLPQGVFVCSLAKLMASKRTAVWHVLSAFQCIIILFLLFCTVRSSFSNGAHSLNILWPNHFLV